MNLSVKLGDELPTCAVISLKTQTLFLVSEKFDISETEDLQPTATICHLADAFIQSASRQHDCIHLKLRLLQRELNL